jgi:hypothetical protein
MTRPLDDRALTTADAAEWALDNCSELLAGVEVYEADLRAAIDTLRECRDIIAAAHPAAVALTAERDRLRDELAAERGERGPEGWEYRGGAWFHPARGTIARRDVITENGIQIRWCRTMPDGWPMIETGEPTALEAMQAADRAAEGREG